MTIAPNSPASIAHAPVEPVNIVTTESLLDGFDGDLDMDPPPDPEPRAKKPKSAKMSDLKPEDFDEDGEGEPEPEKPKKPLAKPPKEDGEEEDSEPAAAADDVPAELERPWPKDKGTKEKPLALKDLPENVFVQVKVDGKQDTVSLKDYAQGIIRMETFHGSFNRANQAYEEATQIAERAVNERDAIRTDLRALFRTPPRLFKHLFENHPREMLDLGRMIAQQFKAWHEDPEAQRAHEYGIQQRQLETERQRVARERQQWEQQQQTARTQAEQRAAWEPVYAKVMKEAGFPKLTAEFQDDVRAFLAHAKTKVPDGKISPEMFEAIFKRVLSMHKLEKVQARQPTAPANPPRAPTPKNGKGRDWSGASIYEKMRSADFFLR